MWLTRYRYDLSPQVTVDPGVVSFQPNSNLVTPGNVRFEGYRGDGSLTTKTARASPQPRDGGNGGSARA